ncbi:MAG: hypothetical protein WBH04_16960, partial [Albidovulum sp.]
RRRYWGLLNQWTRKSGCNRLLFRAARTSGDGGLTHALLAVNSGFPPDVLFASVAQRRQLPLK